MVALTDEETQELEVLGYSIKKLSDFQIKEYLRVRKIKIDLRSNGYTCTDSHYIGVLMEALDPELSEALNQFKKDVGLI